MIQTRPSAAIGASMIGLALLSGCGSESLQDRDPQGYAACGIAAVGDDGDSAVSLAAGRHAAEASTKSIAATAGDPVDVTDAGMEEPFILANMDALKAACKDEGYDD